jgi:hypothetical protein
MTDQKTLTTCSCLACDPKSGEIGRECSKVQTMNGCFDCGYGPCSMNCGPVIVSSLAKRIVDKIYDITDMDSSYLEKAKIAVDAILKEKEDKNVKF